MAFLSNALEALPTVASSPYALLGYLATVAAWALAMHRSVRLKFLMAKLKDIPSEDRARIIQLEMGEVLPSHISAEQWLRARNHRHFMIAGLALLVTITVIGAVAINAALELEKSSESSELRREEASNRQYAIQSKRKELEDRMQAIEESISEAEREFQRGLSGLKFAPQDQKHLAQEIMQSAAAEIERLQEEKTELQAKNDALPLQ